MGRLSALESLDTPEPKQSHFAGFRLKNKTSINISATPGSSDVGF
jgi:hypothetical protein